MHDKKKRTMQIEDNFATNLSDDLEKVNDYRPGVAQN